MYGSGPGKVDLHGARVDPEANFKIDLSLLQRQSAPQEKHGSMGDSTFSASVYYLGPGDRRLCMRLALYVHYRPFSVTSEESLRDSEPRIPEHQWTGDFMRS